MALIILAGCSGEKTASYQVVADPAAVARDAHDTGGIGKDSAAVANQQLYVMIPGLQFDTSLNVVENRLYTSEAGDARQGFSLEYLEGDASSVMASMQDAFVAAGYKPRGKEATAEGGVLKQNFVKSGQPTPFVAVYPTPGKSPVNPQTKGRVWISWKLLTQAATVSDPLTETD